MMSADDPSSVTANPEPPAVSAGLSPPAPGRTPREGPSPEEQEDALRRERLQRVMQRIEAQPDFASTKDSMLGIQKVSHSDRSHVRALSNLIVDDTAMVSKLLRLIHAAYYQSVGGGRITSIQRAIALMGFQSIGLLASSLTMFERLPKGADGAALRREFARSQFAAMLAHDFCHQHKLMDCIYSAALFQRLGYMLGGLYFAEELRAFDDQLDERELAVGSVERQQAHAKLAKARWGLSIEEIGLEVARRWGWPDSVLVGMRRRSAANPQLELTGDEYVGVLCTVANDLADELMRLPDTGTSEEKSGARRRVVERFAAAQGVALCLGPEQLHERVEHAKLRWDDLLSGLGISVAEASGNAPEPVQKGPKLDPNSQAYKQELAEKLADAIDHLRRMNHKGSEVMEVTEAALRQLKDALGLQRAVACLRDSDTGRLTGRIGLGDKATTLPAHFDIALDPPTDLFGMLCSKNADTLITNTADPLIAQRLPDWYHKKVNAGAFLLLPLATDRMVVGMLYGDQRDAGTLHVHPRALTLLKTLRNEVLRGMKLPVPMV
ncbi:MAG: HDOD domain-containing protein [Rubrivivax sp.]